MKPDFSKQNACEEDDLANHSDESPASVGSISHRAADWTADFGRGWGPLKLGMAFPEVIQTLEEHGIEFLQPSLRRVEVPQPYSELSFDAHEPPRLVDIYLESDEVHRGHEVIDQPLSKALQMLRISSVHLHDTQWSMVSGECEFDDMTGQPISDSSRQRTATTEELLRCSFLWLKPLGVGLSIFNAQVNGISIRDPARIPGVGCGPLTDKQFELLHSPELEPFLAKAWSHDQVNTRFRTAVLFSMSLIPVIGYLLYGYRHLIMDLLR